jgi:serine/threonine protein kinase
LLEDRGYNKSVDIFSAGVILHVLLTGRPVFRGYNVNEILLKNKKCEVEYPPKYWDKISMKAKDLVMRMLERDPSKRITASEALEHEWFKQDEGEINDVIIDIKEGIEEENENREKIDYNKLNDADEEEIKLVSATPIMAKRNLHQGVPETPFLQ